MSKSTDPTPTDPKALLAMVKELASQVGERCAKELARKNGPRRDAMQELAEMCWRMRELTGPPTRESERTFLFYRQGNPYNGDKAEGTPLFYLAAQRQDSKPGYALRKLIREADDPESDIPPFEDGEAVLFFEVRDPEILDRVGRERHRGGELEHVFAEKIERPLFLATHAFDNTRSEHWRRVKAGEIDRDGRERKEDPDGDDDA